MRQVDKFPMIVRFVSDFIRVDPNMPANEMTKRAFDLADIIANQIQSEPDFQTNRKGHPFGERRVKNPDGLSSGGVRVWTPLR